MIVTSLSNIKFALMRQPGHPLTHGELSLDCTIHHPPPSAAGPYLRVALSCLLLSFMSPTTLYNPDDIYLAARAKPSIMCLPSFPARHSFPFLFPYCPLAALAPPSLMDPFFPELPERRIELSTNRGEIAHLSISLNLHLPPHPHPHSCRAAHTRRRERMEKREVLHGRLCFAVFNFQVGEGCLD